MYKLEWFLVTVTTTCVSVSIVITRAANSIPGKKQSSALSLLLIPGHRPLFTLLSICHPEIPSLILHPLRCPDDTSKFI